MKHLQLFFIVPKICLSLADTRKTVSAAAHKKSGKSDFQKTSEDKKEVRKASKQAPSVWVRKTNLAYRIHSPRIS